MPYASDKRRALTAIFIVFLFIFSEILVTENNHKIELAQDNNIGYVIYEYSTIAETHIDSANPDSNYLSATEVLIGENTTTSGEARGLYRFINNLSSSTDIILDAELTVTCNVIAEDVQGTAPILYPATIIANFAPTEVTWNEIADSINWQVSGIEGSNDRTDWDLPSSSSQVVGTTYEYNLNVTKLAQTSLELGRNKFDFALTSVGGELSCFKDGSGNSGYDPELTINNQAGVHGDGGSVSVPFLQDGLPLMTDDFIPEPDTHPTIIYNSLVGNDVEFQFSLVEDYRATTDDYWIYSTMTNTFAVTGSAGEYDIPANQAFNIGDTVYYRYRSIDSTAKISQWTSGSFLLPGYSVTNNNDGTATLNISNNDFNLQGFKLIENTFVASSNPNQQQGSAVLLVENEPASQSIVHLGINLHLLGLPSNLTVLDASVELTRLGSTNYPMMLSMHEYTGTDWVENEATWNYGRIGNTWSNGGMDTIDSAQDTGINSQQTSNTFAISVHDSAQQYIAENRNSRVNYLLTGMLPGEQAPLQTEGIIFAGDSGNTALRPTLNLTYSFPVNNSIAEATLIGPVEGQPVWNSSDYNLSGNTMPVMNWETSDGSLQNSIVQISSDPYFRNIILEQNSMTIANLPTNSDSYAVNGIDALNAGQVYHWRVKHFDNDGLNGLWNETSFFISSTTSEWLGGNLHKLIINTSIDPNIPTIPEFIFSTISSNSPNTNSYGYPYMSAADSPSARSNALLGINIENYLLPSGLAVVGSELKLSTIQVSGNPQVGIWSMSNHDWDQEEVTWLESSTGTPWSGPGGTGSGDRTSLLDSQVVSSGSQFAWNVTSAVQDSMRNAERLDFMIEILPGQSSSDALFYSPVSSNINYLPTVEIIYTPGSNQQPLPPSAYSPTNGQWVFANNSTLETDNNPIIEWTPNNQVPIIGWGLEIDTTDEFSSPNKLSVSSWDDQGFDIVNNQYELQSNLQIGKQYFWRVRALSATYQLGEWSPNFHFYLPDFNFDLVDSNTFTTEISHNSALENSNLLNFIDASILDSNLQTVNNNINQQFLEVGTNNFGLNSSMLLNIPIPLQMHPENASVIGATLHLESTPLTTSGIPVAAREVLQPWNESVDSLTYDGINNWTKPGGRSIGGDISSPLDIQNSVSGGLMSWNITPLIQQAFDSGQNHVSIMLYASDTQLGEMVYFSSSESLVNQPKLNLSWSFGERELPSGSTIPVSPTPGQIYFNQTSHAIIPDKRPTFNWQWSNSNTPTPDAWIISFDLDPVNDMSGDIIFDSRVDSALFNLAALEFTPDVDIDYNNEIHWSVRPINNSMFGTSSQVSTYLIPSAMGEELSSTDARITIQDGSIFSPTNYPQATTDTYLDEGAPATGQDTNGLMIGNSSFANSNLSSTNAVISFDTSMLSLPATYEILSATLSLNAVSGSGIVDISASRMYTSWDESATWNNNTTGNQWNLPGALRSSDSDLPDSLVTVTSPGIYDWDVTRIVQLSHAAGNQQTSILLQPEIFNSPSGVIDGNYIFADSENVTINLRPKLIIEYRTTPQWLAPAPNLIYPVDSATLWNTSSYDLVGPDEISFEFTSQVSNVTSWQICHGQEIRWLDCESSTDLDSDFSYNSLTKSFLLDNSTKIEDYFGDQWQYWRIRGDQNHRIGYYSPIYEYRMTDSQAQNDGFGNYSINLTRGSIFEITGELPSVIDSVTDSANQQANYGSDSILNLGYDPTSAGYNQAYFMYNLSELYFDSFATPISAIFEIQLSGTQQNINPIEVSVYACSTFDETAISYANSPTCSSDEITKTTISSNTANSVQWDITSLLQENFLTNNRSISFTLATSNSVTNYVQFYSSENLASLKPKLSLTYIENIGGLTPPSQVTLVSPSNGEIMYDTSGDIVTPLQTVQLTWVQNPDATDYILYLNNKNSVQSFDSRYDSSIQGNTFTSSQFLPGEVYEWWVQGVNQSIPGPSSQRWSFAIGNPNHIYNNDGTYSYTVYDSVEVPSYSHINVLDNTITDAFPIANFGQSEDLLVGEGCFSTTGSTCSAIISLDTSQIPVNSDKSIHSVELSLLVDQWDFSGGAYAMDISVHQFLLSGWSELGSTWNNTGSTPGPSPGIDYISAPLDTGTFYSSDSKLNFQIASETLVLGDNIMLILIGTPLGTGNVDGFVSLHSSDDSQQIVRPKFTVKHTNISSLNISTTSTQFDADNVYLFDIQGLDSSGNVVPGNLPNGAVIEWTTTTGTITPTGLTSALLSPTTSGTQTLSACFGVICSSYVFNIESGLPVQLFASLNQSSDVDSVTISADETIAVYAYAVDQHNNLVTTEVISYVASNGSIDLNGVFSPYTSGQQTIIAEWIGSSNTLQEILEVNVLPGTPTSVVLTGCTETLTADTSCDLFASAYDQFG
ncbi:MAG: DNRLRE domain-containing protein, partial [Candidatus Thermoplasmatota archaeon]|nr:DNRLRE domain-containing protein [Candidatus Thermoplasmatota archaeon]